MDGDPTKRVKFYIQLEANCRAAERCCREFALLLILLRHSGVALEELLPLQASLCLKT